MRIIKNSRHSGRTTKLIKMSARNDIPILVTTENEKLVIKGMADALKLGIPEPIVYRHDIDMSKIKSVYIDNMDILLQSIIGTHIDTCTIEEKLISYYNDNKYKEQSNRPFVPIHRNIKF